MTVGHGGNCLRCLREVSGLVVSTLREALILAEFRPMSKVKWKHANNTLNKAESPHPWNFIRSILQPFAFCASRLFATWFIVHKLFLFTLVLVFSTLRRDHWIWLIHHLSSEEASNGWVGCRLASPIFYWCMGSKRWLIKGGDWRAKVTLNTSVTSYK